MPNEFEAVAALADTEFASFATTLSAAGVDADKAWQAVDGAKVLLAHAASVAEDAINAARDDPYLTEEARHLKIRQARDEYEAAEKQHSRALSGGIEILQAVLEGAARSDLVVADPVTRMLIRQDLSMAVAGAKGSILGQLFEMAKANPQVAAELSTGGFGEALLKQNGEGPEIISRFKQQITLATTGQTPKARAARAALQSLARVQAHAATTLPSAARARIEAAAAPRQTNQIRPDTIRPRR